MKRKHSMTAVLFLAGLLAGLLILASSFFGQEGKLETLLKSFVRSGDVTALVTGAEGAANQDLDRSHFFIQLFGGVQRLMGRRAIVDMAEADYTVVKMDDGALTFENLSREPVDVTPHGEALVQLDRALRDQFDLPLLYIQAPQKASNDALPTGITDYGNGYADSLLSVLAENGVDYLDLRPGMEAAAAQPDAPAFFFRTDHHWTPEGGFAGYQILSRYLDEHYGMEAPALFTDPDSYEKIVYENYFLGSQGKRVGTLYAGTDDITLWKPKFETSFTYSVPLNAIERTGPFEESLLFPERVAEKDYFGGNPYTLYAGGDYNLARMTNHFNPDGPRILLIRDSYSCVLAPFLALNCSEVVTIDLRYFKENVLDYIEWLDPDLVCVMYTASSTRLPELFQFFGAEEKPGFRY